MMNTSSSSSPVSTDASSAQEAGQKQGPATGGRRQEKIGQIYQVLVRGHFVINVESSFGRAHCCCQGKTTDK